MWVYKSVAGSRLVGSGWSKDWFDKSRGELGGIFKVRYSCFVKSRNQGSFRHAFGMDAANERLIRLNKQTAYKDSDQVVGVGGGGVRITEE